MMSHRTDPPRWRSCEDDQESGWEGRGNCRGGTANWLESCTLPLGAAPHEGRRQESWQPPLWFGCARICLCGRRTRPPIWECPQPATHDHPWWLCTLGRPQQGMPAPVLPHKVRLGSSHTQMLGIPAEPRPATCHPPSRQYPDTHNARYSLRFEFSQRSCSSVGSSHHHRAPHTNICYLQTSTTHRSSHPMRSLQGRNKWMCSGSLLILPNNRIENTQFSLFDTFISYLLRTILKLLVETSFFSF